VNYHILPEKATDKVISMKTLIIKSLLTSLYQREGNYPSLAKRGEGRFFNNVVLLITALVTGYIRKVDEVPVFHFL